MWLAKAGYIPLIKIILHARNQTFILKFEQITHFCTKSRNPHHGKYQILKYFIIENFEDYEKFHIFNEYTAHREISSLGRSKIIKPFFTGCT